MTQATTADLSLLECSPVVAQGQRHRVGRDTSIQIRLVEILLDLRRPMRNGVAGRCATKGPPLLDQKKLISAIEDDHLSQRRKRERKEVIQRLDEWVKALYKVRNAYTHGKVVNEYFFGGRSLWQDAFEIFRLAANRTILIKPEKRLPAGSALEKRLMSVLYFDEAVSFFGKKGDWMNAGRKRREVQTLKEMVRKARTLGPELVESISSLGVLRQGLFNMCTASFNVVERSNRAVVLQVKEAMCRAYAESRDAKGKLDTDKYIRKVAPRFSLGMPGLPFASRSIFLFEFVEAFKMLLSVYGNFTRPIFNTLSDLGPPFDSA